MCKDEETERNWTYREAKNLQNLRNRTLGTSVVLVCAVVGVDARAKDKQKKTQQRLQDDESRAIEAEVA